MTQVGHIITGIAIGVISMPEKKSTREKLLHLAIFALLANVPDFPFKNWGHDRYIVSHSMFINLFIMLSILPLLVYLKDFRTRIGGWPVVIGGAFSWLSHLLLDTFYNHGLGLRMFWPLNRESLALPIPWFSVVRNPLSWNTVHIMLVEFACYGGLLLMVIVLKKSRIFHRLKTTVS